MRRLIILLISFNLVACAHQPLTWEHTRQAANAAAMHPSVWGPLLGAGVFAASNLDERTSKSLSAHTPVFGSQSSADQASTDLQDLLIVTAGVSALMAPVVNTGQVTIDRGDRLGIVLGGIVFSSGISESMKYITQRERPDQSNNYSFPSGHTTAAFTSASLASENFHMAWGDDARAGWADAGLYTAASLTAWARVEAKKHYASDVMAGAALGNFMGHFLNELLLENSGTLVLSSSFDGNSMLVGIQHRF
ncbi:MAG: phosphatase PAP2 family protein [Gammaproteobacteria bacterium]